MTEFHCKYKSGTRFEEADKNGTFICLHEEDPELNGILGFTEQIAKEHFGFWWCDWGR